MRSEQEIMEIYERNVDTVYRIALSFLKNPDDAQDVVQNTFLKMMKKSTVFESLSHEKGWLVLTASNLCKNHLSYWFNHKRGSSSFLDTMASKSEDEEEIKNTLQLVLDLPNKYKISIYLYYYEGLSTEEIAKHTKKSPSTIRTHLQRGRNLLKIRLEEGELYENQKI